MEHITLNHGRSLIGKLTPLAIASITVNEKYSYHALSHRVDNRYENSLYKYLDFKDLVDVFAERLFSSFSICNIHFSQPDLDIDLYSHFAERNPRNYHKLINYKLRYGNTSLGSLTIALAPEITVFEKSLVDNMVDDLCGPLHNSIRFEKASRSGYRDVLTGLYNRAALEELLFDRSTNIDTNTSTVMICDMDRFKWINDHYGHTAGDNALAQFATKTTTIVDNNGKVYRFGGDEFVVALNTTSESESVRIAEQIQEAAQNCQLLDGTSLSVTIGAAKVDCDESLRDAFSRADSALLSGKGNGGNTVVWSD